MPKVFLRRRTVELLTEELEGLGVEGPDLSFIIESLVVEARRARRTGGGGKPEPREARVRGRYS